MEKYGLTQTHSTYTHTQTEMTHTHIRIQSVGANKYMLVHVGIVKSDEGSQYKKPYLLVYPCLYL